MGVTVPTRKRYRARPCTFDIFCWQGLLSARISTGGRRGALPVALHGPNQTPRLPFLRLLASAPHACALSYSSPHTVPLTSDRLSPRHVGPQLDRPSWGGPRRRVPRASLAYVITLGTGSLWTWLALLALVSSCLHMCSPSLNVFTFSHLWTSRPPV